MAQHQLALRDMVRRWAGAYVIAYCVLAGVAIGRLIVSQLLQPGYGIGILLLALHIVAANAILARMLLVSYSRMSRLVAGLAGISVSLVVTAGISGAMSQLSPGSLAAGLLIVLPSILLTGVALASARKERGSVFSVTPVVAAVLVVLTLIGIFTETGGVVLLVLSALESAAMHAVWLSAMYVVAGFILQSRVPHRGQQPPITDVS